MKELKILTEDIQNIKNLPSRLYNEKSYLFINGEVRLIIIANHASEALKWLEINHYIKRNQSSGMIFYQLSDDVVGLDEHNEYYSGVSGYDASKWHEIAALLDQFSAQIQGISNFFDA